MTKQLIVVVSFVLALAGVTPVSAQETAAPLFDFTEPTPIKDIITVLVDESESGFGVVFDDPLDATWGPGRLGINSFLGTIADLLEEHGYEAVIQGRELHVRRQTQEPPQTQSYQPLPTPPEPPGMLEFRNAQRTDVLNALAGVHDLNIVEDVDVLGTFNGELTGVPVGEALNRVLNPPYTWYLDGPTLTYHVVEQMRQQERKAFNSYTPAVPAPARDWLEERRARRYAASVARQARSYGYGIGGVGYGYPGAGVGYGVGGGYYNPYLAEYARNFELRGDTGVLRSTGDTKGVRLYVNGCYIGEANQIDSWFDQKAATLSDEAVVVTSVKDGEAFDRTIVFPSRARGQAVDMDHITLGIEDKYFKAEEGGYRFDPEAAKAACLAWAR